MLGGGTREDVVLECFGSQFYSSAVGGTNKSSARGYRASSSSSGGGGNNRSSNSNNSQDIGQGVANQVILVIRAIICNQVM